MDDKQIMNELRGLALAEPLLGFDPDDVATKAAKGVRNRRATLTDNAPAHGRQLDLAGPLQHQQ